MEPYKFGDRVVSYMDDSCGTVIAIGAKYIRVRWDFSFSLSKKHGTTVEHIGGNIDKIIEENKNYA